MTNIDYLERMALAGLLHDIGKFAQRGIRDRPRLKHTEAGSDFVREFVPEVLRKGLYPVLGHHDAVETMDGMTKVVALADRLSAGERREYPPGARREFAQMRSIFSRVSLGGDTPPPVVYVPLAETQVAEKSRLMPQRAQSDQASLTDAYAALWEDFCRDARQLHDGAQQHDDAGVYLESLYHLLARYTATIPAAFYYDEPDVSLFDHSRVTAALACCIASMEEKQIDALLRDVDHKDATLWEGTPVALLVGGDISGVQDFIYMITSEHAAKLLRGRSLYLQLLTEAVLRYALRQLRLPITSVLYSGGAHFFLLAPPTAAETLEHIRVEVTRKLWAHHRADLYLALGWTTLAAADFTVARGDDAHVRITERWNAMHRQLIAAKRARYRELGDDIHATVFRPPETGGDPEHTCPVCQNENTTKPEEPGPLCASFDKELGQPLPRATHLVLGVGEPEDAERGDCLAALRAFGLRVALFGERDQSLKGQLDGSEYAVILALRDGVGAGPGLSMKTARGTRYTVNLIPPSPFNQFDQLEKQAKGIKRLGVLRMDMDNLGDIFRRGLGREATLSRLASLSRVVSLFFEGRVAEICKEVSDLIYVVYAGGDDLFLMGPWDLMPGLARRIHDELNELTGGNKDVHVSAGIALIGGKYPVYQAADDTKEALERAKGQTGKDAITLLGRTCKWEAFVEVEEVFEKLVALVDARAPKGLLTRLLALDALYEETQMWRVKRGYQATHAGPWVWRGSYALVRLMQQYSEKETIRQGIADLYERLTHSGFANLPQVGLAARWAQLRLRERPQEEV